jgi:hypothetical protein
MENLTNVALLDERTGSYLDPISLELMTDPVTAADGFNYERSFITQWFETKKPIVSPMTNARLKSSTVTPNIALKNEIQNFIISSIGKMSDKIDIKFNLSSDIYKELDRVSNLKLMETLKLRAPQIVVLGNESHGKSTLLERIIGLPIFPRDRNICTRCPIRVKIRRGEPSIAKLYVVQTVRAADPKIKVGDSVRLVQKVGDTVAVRRDQTFLVQRIDYNDTATVYDSMNYRNLQHPLSTLELVNPPKPKFEVTESAPDYAPLDGIRDVIKRKMDALASGGIAADKEIVVEVFLRNGMNIDILDLPGLVSTSLNGVDLRAQTEELAAKIINEEKDYSFFLLVNDIRVPSNQSRGCEIVEKHSLQDKTLGIFSKLDVFTDEEGDEANELRKRLNCQTPASFRVKHGWMGTCSKPVPAASAATPTGASTGKGVELRKLYAIEAEERRILSTNFPELYATGLVGIHNIRQKIQQLYDEFIVTKWVPHITQKLNEHYESNMSSFQQLGTPVFPSDMYGNEGNQFLSQKKLVLSNDILQSEIQLRLKHLVKSSEQTWLPLSKKKKLWKAISDYREYVEKIETESERKELEVTEQRRDHDPYRNYHHNYNEPSKITCTVKSVVSNNKYITAVPVDDVDRTIGKHIDKLTSTIREICQLLQASLDGTELYQAFINDANFTTQRQVTELDRFSILCNGIRSYFEERFVEVKNEFQHWVEQEIVAMLIADDTNDPMIRLSTVKDRVFRKEYCVKDGTLMCQLYWMHFQLVHSLPDLCVEQFYRLLKHKISSCVNMDFVNKFNLQDHYVVNRHTVLRTLITTNEVIDAIKKFSATNTTQNKTTNTPNFRMVKKLEIRYSS